MELSANNEFVSLIGDGCPSESTSLIGERRGGEKGEAGGCLRISAAGFFTGVSGVSRSKELRFLSLFSLRIVLLDLLSQLLGVMC